VREDRLLGRGSRGKSQGGWKSGAQAGTKEL
jgi:hypothetical protein